MNSLDSGDRVKLFPSPTSRDPYEWGYIGGSWGPRPWPEQVYI